MLRERSSLAVGLSRPSSLRYYLFGNVVWNFRDHIIGGILSNLGSVIIVGEIVMIIVLIVMLTVLAMPASGRSTTAGANAGPPSSCPCCNLAAAGRVAARGAQRGIPKPLP